MKRPSADFFRPEFFNRVDAVVSFRPLDAVACRAIVRKELADLERREGLSTGGHVWPQSDVLVEYLLRSGFDSRYGARPLQRALERHVVTPLARHLLAHPDLRGAKIHLDIDPAGNLVAGQ